MESARDREREKKRRNGVREGERERKREKEGGSTSLAASMEESWIDGREGSGEGRPLWWRLKEPILS